MTDSESIEKVFRSAKRLAALWRKCGFPVTFDRVVNIDGVDVRVIVERADLKRRSETELETMLSEQNIDL